MDSTIESRRDLIRRIARKHGARELRVFGSRARGDAEGSSDLDLLVEMEPGRSLLDLIALEQELERSLGIPVDVLTPGSISPYLRDQIQSEAVPL
jgi:uncharacterized protein